MTLQLSGAFCWTYAGLLEEYGRAMEGRMGPWVEIDGVVLWWERWAWGLYKRRLIAVCLIMRISSDLYLFEESDFRSFENINTPSF